MRVLSTKKWTSVKYKFSETIQYTYRFLRADPFLKKGSESIDPVCAAKSESDTSGRIRILITGKGWKTLFSLPHSWKGKPLAKDYSNLLSIFIVWMEYSSICDFIFSIEKMKICHFFVFSLVYSKLFSKESSSIILQAFG